MNFEDLVPDVTDLGQDFADALSSWSWLLARAVKPLMITILGDLFVQDGPEVWFLDTMRGTFEKVAPSRDDWKRQMGDASNVFKWFQPPLVEELLAHAAPLASGEVYSPIVPPALGGKMNAANYSPSPWRAHLDTMGQIHQQIHNLPAGTPITLKFDSNE